MATRSTYVKSLLLQGVRTSTDIQRAVGISQPVASRLIAELGTDVIRIGSGRTTRYGLRREVAGIGSEWPVIEIDDRGEPHAVGTLHALQRDQYWFAARVPIRSTLTDGLPTFLLDLRPQGFVGRSVPLRYPELGLPERINAWDDSDALRCLVRRGEDGIGNILMGEESLNRYMQQVRAPVSVIAQHDQAVEFEKLAERAIAGEQAGSSAGGEHPKFTCVIDRSGAPHHVLVKFSPAGEDPVSRRWSDLLIAEHLAMSVLTSSGVSSARTSVLANGRRVFLVSERFDRTGLFGRKGVISLAAVDDELIGGRKGWIHAGKALLALKKITVSDYDRIRRLAAFGQLIANTDMHPGNLSFLVAEDGSLDLAPVYDMLPMMYAPTPANALPDHAMRAPAPRAEMLDVWTEMAQLAVECWTTLSTHDLVSTDFAALARRNAETVRIASRIVPSHVS
ncbi:MAG: type II toxin-antitoxin system HipA family toxin YjjJ [Proteobacteria bacterium]|nr:type II toxin-antitoxin system HipA family toxin YjjJ [Pseudomonadota bacterium]